MNSFERELRGDLAIPFGEAANFYLRMRQPTAEAEKTAGLADEPDTTGELEGAFAVPKETVVALMQDAITKAMTMLQASLVYSVSMKGGVEKMAVERALGCRDYEYRDIVNYLSKRASVLAGAVHVGDAEPPPPSTDPVTVAKAMIRGDQELIQSLQAIKEAVGENPMCSRICQYMSSAQERMDDMWRALDPEGAPAAAPEAQGLMDEAGPEVADEAAVPGEGLEHDEATETPEDEAAESDEVQAAEQEAGTEEHEPPEAEEAEEEVEEPAEDEKDAAASKEVKDRLREARVKGTERGVTQARKSVVVDRERRGQRYGKALGSVAGAVGGAAAGKKLIGGKGPAGTIAGLAAGMLAGREAGGAAGRSADISRHLKKKSKGKTKKASVEERFQLALRKLAQDPGMPMEPEAPMAPGSGGEGPGMPQQPVGLAGPDAAAGPPAEAGAPPPPAPAATQPTNFLEAELMGQQAQGVQEAQYYKQQAEEAQGAAGEMQQAIEGMQQQLQELQMQADQASQSIQQSTQSAMSAQDDALKQTQIAANMRMGMQKLRAQMLEVASQDPAEVAAQELQAPGAPQPMDPSAMGPDAAGAGGMPASPAKAEKEVEEADRAQSEADMQAMQAEQAVPPPPPEGTPPPGAVPSPSGGADMATMAPTSGLKAASAKTAGVMEQAKQRLPWALAGAGLGAAYGKHQTMAGPALQQRVQDLEAKGEGGFSQAMKLTAARAQAAEADVAGQHPGAAIGFNALRGAAAGALLGPSIQQGAQRIARNTKAV